MTYTLHTTQRKQYLTNEGGDLWCFISYDRSNGEECSRKLVRAASFEEAKGKL